eukprot:749247-Rhodomonas_salina.2
MPDVSTAHLVCQYRAPRMSSVPRTSYVSTGPSYVSTAHLVCQYRAPRMPVPRISYVSTGHAVARMPDLSTAHLVA